MTENERVKRQAALFETYAHITTPEQYEKIVNIVKNMSDQQFQEVIDQAEKYIDENNISPKTIMNLTAQVQLEIKKSGQNTAADSGPALFLSKTKTDDIIEKLEESRASDVIRLSSETDVMLIDLWERSGEEMIQIPSDLFFANTIPMMDCRIIVDETDLPNGSIADYRVSIFKDYAEIIRNSTENEAVVIGVLIMNVAGAQILIRLSVSKGYDCILSAGVGFKNTPMDIQNICRKQYTKASISQALVSHLETWYGIQIALLHPTVKDVVRVSKPVIDEPKAKKHNSKKPNKNRTVRYIKEHVLNAAELSNVIYGQPTKPRKMKALVWYVIGHWRTYQNGQKSFVKPYWKGALRGIKPPAIDQERKREIVIPEIITQ